jgi:hypothetical protein
MSPVSRATEVKGRVRTDDGFEFDAVVASSRASTSISIESNVIQVDKVLFCVVITQVSFPCLVFA